MRPFALFLLSIAAPLLVAQTSTPQKPSPEDERIVVKQTGVTGTGEAHARQLLQQMADAIGGPHRMSRQDYRLEGRTATFFKNNAT